MNKADRRSGAALKAKIPTKDPLRRWIIYVSIALVVLGIIIAVAYSSRTNSRPIAFPTPVKLQVGQVAPEFSAATNQGPFDLAQAVGKPVFLEIFATWCPHCQRETKVLNGLYDAYKNQVAFVAVTGNMVGMDATTPASQEDMMNFAQRFKVRYPLAYDPDLAVANKYMQSGYPSLIVIGKDHKIAFLSSGESTAEALEKALDAVIKAPYVKS
jgi:cytochrome c biogenesis protein CcmG, thiol:disulfide interchange protein DsbE